MDLTGRGEAGGSFRRFVRSGIASPFTRVGRRAGMGECVHRNAMQATDSVFGLPWINCIFNEFERLRNKICRKICKYQIFVVSLCRNSKNNQIMEQQITFDKRNYRKHSEKNKAIIRKSLQELGAGRCVC